MGENQERTIQNDKSLPKKESFIKDIFLPAVVILVVILLGIGTAWVIGKRIVPVQGSLEKNAVAPGVKVGKGGSGISLEDTSTFRDTATGILKRGGFEGEGTYHLVRDGGPSQYVYLTSSVIDLSQFIEAKLKSNDG